MDRPRDALPEGTKLAGYVIGRVLGRGGFGVTYFGHDALFPDTKVAIKEFLPSGLAVREAGSLTVHPSGPGYAADFKKALSRFEDEARTLVALRHPNVVDVQRYIEANGTAYVVMKYEEGRSLSELLGGGKTLSAHDLGDIVAPLLDGLEAVHKRNYLHRDIKPGNIYIRAADGSPVLLDFGAARQAMGAERKTSLTEIVTPGYAPFEQYFRKGEQGPWTDIYALGATFYRCMAGTAPPEAPERVRRDEMISARDAGRGRYPEAQLAGIDAMLAVDERKRPQSVAEVRKLLGSANAVSPPSRHAQPTLVAGAPPPASQQRPHDFRWPREDLSAPKRLPSSERVRMAEIDEQVRAHSRPGMAGAALFVVSALVVVGYFLLRSGPDPAPGVAHAPGTPGACKDGSTWRAGCVFRDCPDCPEMVVIPAGTFTMGSNEHSSEQPLRRITFSKPFALGKYEVTFSEWDFCVATKICRHSPLDGEWGRGKRPVIGVSWHDASEYLSWLNGPTPKGQRYRLPSEAEWEYAARAGAETRFAWGNDIGLNRANCADCRSQWDRRSTAPVGSFPANRFGLHDMHGNVWEWTDDCWDTYRADGPLDGSAWRKGDCSQRLVRGGSWIYQADALRASFRYPFKISERELNRGLGLRLARDLE